MTKPVQTTLGNIGFKLHVIWPESDVDVVYTELGSSFQGDRIAKTRTPTTESVDNMLEAMFRDEVLKEHGIRVEATSGLMMGGCHIEFEIDSDRINELQSLIKIADQRVRHNRRQYVRYYKKDYLVSGRRVQEIVS